VTDINQGEVDLVDLVVDLIVDLSVGITHDRVSACSVQTHL